MALAFGLGLLWMTGIQTKLLVRSKSDVVMFAWALATSLIWGYLVRSVVISPAVILPYAVGTAFGALLARRIGKKLEAK